MFSLKIILPVPAFVALVLLASCGARSNSGGEVPRMPADTASARTTGNGTMNESTFAITSSAFQEGGEIPPKYTCDGPNISPPLAWSGIPSGAKTLALIVDDPDAPSKTWVHWVVYNIPASMASLPEDFGSGQDNNGAHGGRNDFGKPTYGGPCPPNGTHHYHFKLYALDTPIDGDFDKPGLLNAMKGHTLGTTELIGLYSHK